jgi:hypothetical protein
MTVETLVQPLEFLLKLQELLVRAVLQVDEPRARPLHGPDQLVELDLGGHRVTVLGVLDEEHHEERDDRGTRVDDELPAVGVGEDRPGQPPHDDDGDGDDECPRRSHPLGDSLGELPEQVLHSLTSCPLSQRGEPAP